MNTQTHALMGAALLGSAQSLSNTWAAVAGGLAPDVPMIVMVASARWIGGKSGREIFGTLYFLPLWTLALTLALALGWSSAAVFAASGLLHIALDFFLHHDDAHRQFWPLSNWRFASPVSYWDTRHYGALFRPFELALTLGFTGTLLTRHQSYLAMALLGTILLLTLAQAAYFWRRLRRRARDSAKTAA
jgi:LexA-binding, inner membrane-associated putative hydrolase